MPLLQNLLSQSKRQGNFTLPSATSFNWTSDVSLVDNQVSPLLDAIGADLSAFKNAGGKLLVTQGWSDPYNAPTWPMEHLASIEQATGPGVEGEEWMRLFMIPGSYDLSVFACSRSQGLSNEMLTPTSRTIGGGHCGPSPHYLDVPYEADTLETMIDWVEKGITPREMRASKAAIGSSHTRKLCAWPLVARYRGDKAGEDNSSWEGFDCVEQK